MCLKCDGFLKRTTNPMRPLTSLLGHQNARNLRTGLRNKVMRLIMLFVSSKMDNLLGYNTSAKQGSSYWACMSDLFTRRLWLSHCDDSVQSSQISSEYFSVPKGNLSYRRCPPPKKNKRLRDFRKSEYFLKQSQNLSSLHQYRQDLDSCQLKTNTQTDVTYTSFVCPV